MIFSNKPSEKILFTSSNGDIFIKIHVLLGKVASILRQNVLRFLNRNLPGKLRWVSVNQNCGNIAMKFADWKNIRSGSHASRIDVDR